MPKGIIEMPSIEVIDDRTNRNTERLDILEQKHIKECEKFWRVIDGVNGDKKSSISGRLNELEGDSKSMKLYQKLMTAMMLIILGGVGTVITLIVRMAG